MTQIGSIHHLWKNFLRYHFRWKYTPYFTASYIYGNIFQNWYILLILENITIYNFYHLQNFPFMENFSRLPFLLENFYSSSSFFHKWKNFPEVVHTSCFYNFLHLQNLPFTIFPINGKILQPPLKLEVYTSTSINYHKW